VQYNTLRRGVNRLLGWFLGEQISFLGTAHFSIFILEGDATMAETEFSAFGRGLQPSWTMHYRAVGGNIDGGDKLRRKDRQSEAVGSDAYSDDYWFSGSFRDHVPNHYQLGYQMVRWGYDRLGDGVWADVARYVSRNPQFITPMPFGLKRNYGLGQRELLRRTFADLNAHWESLPRVENSSERIATPENSYTTYQWPLWLDDSTLVAFKSDLTSTPRIARVDAASGREEILTRTGQISSRPTLSEGMLWWTEFRRSLLWEERVFSRLVSYDLETGRMITHHSDDQIFYPTPLPGSRNIAYVAYDWSGRYSIVRGERRTDLPHGVEVTGLAWDNATGTLYFIGLDDGGMFLAAAGNGEFDRLTPSRHITISDLRAGGGKLYFGSIVSGKDEAHAYDLATGEEYRLTESTYGSFSPSVPNSDGYAALTTYDRHGYHLALQNTAAATPQEQRLLPVDLVNPRWKRWNVPVMDSLVYTPAEAEQSERERPSRRFSRMLNVFQPHSWVPADFYPPTALSETDITANLGATLISQSLLSDAVSWIAYGWNRRGGSMVRGGLSYNGLGPTLDVDFTWGGASQVAYTSIPEWIGLERKKHAAVTARLSLPMAVSSGKWFATLTPSAEYHYTNGLIYRPINEYSGNITRGIERLSLALRYSGQTRMALSEFQPRWGFSARASHVSNPTNRDFKSLWSVSLGAWLPGVVRPHGTRVRLAWQKADDRDNTPFIFQMKEVFPRGARYGFSSRQWRSGSIDYAMPVWYPEAGIPGVLYFKRIRLNLFGDYALWEGFPSSSSSSSAANNGPSSAAHVKWNRLTSYGADITFDLNPMRLPATDHFSATFTVAKPNDRKGVFFNFSLEMPL
jgi:hypothetical protein